MCRIRTQRERLRQTKLTSAGHERSDLPKRQPAGSPAPTAAAPVRGPDGRGYRARDSKLDREVALKLLPDEFAGDPERLARFQREAVA